jgi:retinol-binding protein 3
MKNRSSNLVSNTPKLSKTFSRTRQAILIGGAVLAGVSTSFIANANNGDVKARSTMDCKQLASKNDTAEGLVNQLQAQYIFPSKAKAVANAVKKLKTTKAFQAIDNCDDLAKQLNQVMADTTQDGHLHMAYSVDPIPVQTEEAKQAFKQHERSFMRSLNYGVEGVERFSFNIGYINMTMFADAEVAEDTIAAAMSLVTHTNGLIIDLRYSRGGDPATVDLIASYLLNNKTNTSDIFYREGNRTERRWTSETVKGTRYGEQKPLYILTSKDTFSAAEDFAYTLKHLGRAKIVGEVTGGGAHPGDFVRINEHFEAFIPNGRSINPVTKTNWEGVGVQPDVKVSADNALNIAQQRLLSTMLKDEKNPRKAKRMKRRIESLTPVVSDSSNI